MCFGARASDDERLDLFEHIDIIDLFFKLILSVVIEACICLIGLLFLLNALRQQERLKLHGMGSRLVLELLKNVGEHGFVPVRTQSAQKLYVLDQLHVEIGQALSKLAAIFDI